jgi:hypothetical protein
MLASGKYEGTRMVDTSLYPAIREAIKQNEIGNASPYMLSYARLGESGASFGIFQGDTHVNATARDVLRQVLEAAGADAVTVGRIGTALDAALPHGSPLSPADNTLANDALASARGKALVDAMDTTLLNVVLGYLDRCNAAAAKKGWVIAPVALLYIALWVNMTGAPDTLCKWLGGTSVMGLAPPAGPTVTQANLETYLQATSYFHAHPQNFKHMHDSVMAGAKLLPAGAP